MDQMIYHIGIALMIASAVGGVIAALILRTGGRQLCEHLEREYGPRKKKTRQHTAKNVKKAPMAQEVKNVWKN